MYSPRLIHCCRCDRSFDDRLAEYLDDDEDEDRAICPDCCYDEEDDDEE